MAEPLIRIAAVLALLLFRSSVAAATETRSGFESALAQDPANADLRLRFALFLSRTGDVSGAEKQAKAVLRSAPEYWDAHLLLGRIAGWRRDFKTAMDHVNVVLAHDKMYPGALELKLDLLRWMQDRHTTVSLLSDLIAAGRADAETYYRLAEVERLEGKALRATQHAREALRLDPLHRGARALLGDIRRASLTLTEEFEYYGFDGDEAAPDKKGGSLTVSAAAFPNARFSATATESVHYRFRTWNHRIALRTAYKPRSFLELALMGAVGAPARVIPKGTALAAVRGELLRVMDISASAVFDVLAWPKEDPAFLVRPGLAVGFLVHPRIRLGAAYTLGLLTYCGEAPASTHSGSGSVSWTGERISVHVTGGYAQERDPLSVGISPPASCAEIAETEAWRGESFRTALIQIVHGGFDLTLRFGPRTNIDAGYRFERKKTEPYGLIIPTHISHLGISVWF